MKCNQFEEGDIPYETLEKFGLTHEMIEDLPMHVLEDIWSGRQSPVLPIHITNDEGELIKSRTRFSLVRMEDGKVDVMFYPVLKYAPLEHFDDNQLQLLKEGKAVVADVMSPHGTMIKAFVQIDPETNQVMNVPTPVIGRNLQVLAEELSLGSGEIKTMQNGQPLTFVIDDEPVTVGIDLNSTTGIRFAQGDEQQWKERGKRDWDNLPSDAMAVGSQMTKAITTTWWKTSTVKNSGMSRRRAPSAMLRSINNLTKKKEHAKRTLLFRRHPRGENAAR
jgi:hypothetical protein